MQKSFYRQLLNFVQTPFCSDRRRYARASPWNSALRAFERLPLSLLVLLIAIGCATRQTPTRMEAARLPRPGAKVVLGSIRNVAGQTFEADVETLLKEAMAKELAHQAIAAGGSPTASDFILNLEIAEYRPGNAFKRWLIPGYGATVLGVRGELLESGNTKRVASISHQRTVAVGGLYTVGAWEYVFEWLARDIAKDLKVRIEKGGEFVVSATPRADIVQAVGPVENAKTIQISAVDDRRAEAGRIGQRQAAFGVAMGDVYFSHDVPLFVKEALEVELAAAGHRIVVTGGDLKATGEVLTFWVRTETTPLYWDVVAEMKIALEISGVDGKVRTEYTATSKKRTYVWPTASVLGDTIDLCLDQLMSKIRTDPVWQ
jgi:uncharacterized lipoprotein YajG